MALAQLGVAVGPDPLLEPRRALDVGEQERDGPAAGDGVGVGHPGSDRRAQWSGRFGQVAQPRGQPAQDRQRDARLARAAPPRSPRTRGRGRSSARRRRPARSRGRPSRTDSSPKKSPGPERGDRLAVADDPGAAVDDDEEPGPDLALAGDDVVGREVDLDRHGRRSAPCPSASTPANRRAADSSVAPCGRGSGSSVLQVARRPCCAARHAGRQPRRGRLPDRRAVSGTMADDGRTRGAGRRDRRVRAVRRPVQPAARGHRPPVRGGRLRRGRAGPPPGPHRLRLLRHPRWRGGRSSSTARSGRGSAAATSSARSRSSSASRRSRTSSRPARCAAWSSPGRGSSRSWSTTRGSCTGCSRPRPAGCGPRTDGGAERSPFPPGDYPVVVIGSGPGALQVVVLAAGGSASITRSSRPIRRRAGCSAAGRSSSGCCRGPSRTPRPRAGSRAYERYDWNSLLGEEPGHAGDPAGPDGRHVVLPVAARRWRPTSPRSRNGPASRSATAAAGPATARVDDAGRRPVRGRDDRRRRTAAGSWSSRSASPSRTRRPGPGMEFTAPLRRRPPGRGRTPDRRVLHHRQAELGLRARHRAAAVGAPARPRVAVAGPPVGRHQVAGRRPGALRPAVRGPRPGRRRQRPRRRDRPDRADGRRPR